MGKLGSRSALAVTIALLPGVLHATDYTWYDPVGTAYNWSASGSWQSSAFGAPASSYDTWLIFNADADGRVNNDLGNPFKLNTLRLGSRTGGWNVTGGALDFGPGQINYTSIFSAGGNSRIGNAISAAGGPFYVASTGGSLTLDGSISLSNVQMTCNSNDSNVVLNGPVTGSGSIYFSAGRLTLNNTVPDGTSITMLGGGAIDQRTTVTGSLRLGGTTQVDGVVAGNASVYTEGTATFTGLNTYTGGAYVAGTGTLIGSTRSLPGSISLAASTGTVVFDQNFDSVYAGTVTGAGAFRKLGSGRLDLTTLGVLSGFTGRLEVGGGSVVTNTRVFGGNAVDLSNGATFEMAQNVAGVLTGPINGDGSFVKSGTGNLRIGSGAITGTTTVSGGTLSYADGSFNASDAGFSVAKGATVQLGSGGFLGGATYGNSGTLTVSGSGEIDATLTNAATGKITLSNSALTVGLGANANAGLIGVVGGGLTIQGTLANSGQISGHGFFDFGDGLTNSGTFATTDGLSDVLGAVDNLAGASILSGGAGRLTFHNDVVNDGKEIRTNAGAYTVFLGAVSGSGLSQDSARSSSTAIWAPVARPPISVSAATSCSADRTT